MEIKVTENSAERRAGYLEQETVPDWGLWIPGAPIIHTLGMHFPIDVLWVRRGRVVKRVVDLGPGRLSWGPAWTVLELPAGQSSNLDLAVGSAVALG